MTEIELLNGSSANVRFISRFINISGEPPYYPQAIRAWSQAKAEDLRSAYEKMEPIC